MFPKPPSSALPLVLLWSTVVIKLSQKQLRGSRGILCRVTYGKRRGFSTNTSWGAQIIYQNTANLPGEKYTPVHATSHSITNDSSYCCTIGRVFNPGVHACLHKEFLFDTGMYNFLLLLFPPTRLLIVALQLRFLSFNRTCVYWGIQPGSHSVSIQ